MSDTGTACIVADGYGISVTVRQGHLVITDGLGRSRRTRRIPRIERELRRILVLGHTGTISLEAIRWCAERSITITQIDADNRVLFLTTVPGLNDPRLRRAQALAAYNDTGLEIAKIIIITKIAGQAEVVSSTLGEPALADAVRRYVGTVETATGIAACRDAESHAANAYFGGWARTVGIRFAERDRELVPEHWHTFAARRSPLMRGRTPRVAATPVNALLNYLYALAEGEARTALLTVGLDPGLGIIHVDVKARDSLALDLLEVGRPEVDRYVLDLLRTRNFKATDFVETRDGQCRLMPALAEDLAPTTVLWAKAVAPTAERIAALLGDTTARRQRSTPLTRSNSSPDHGAATRRSTRAPRAAAKAPATLASTCRVCGIELSERRRQLCPGCWPRERAKLATERAQRAGIKKAQLRATDADPTRNAEAIRAHAAGLSAAKRKQLAWDRGGNAVPKIDFQVDVWPALASVPLAQLAQATGLSISACSRIRSGALVPHARHWEPLAKVAAVQPQ